MVHSIPDQLLLLYKPVVWGTHLRHVHSILLWLRRPHTTLGLLGLLYLLHLLHLLHLLAILLSSLSRTLLTIERQSIIMLLAHVLLLTRVIILLKHLLSLELLHFSLLLWAHHGVHWVPILLLLSRSLIRLGHRGPYLLWG